MNGDAWAAAFRAPEPDYSEFDRLDTCAVVFGQCKPELTPQQVAQAVRDAHARTSWCNAKIAAGMGAVFGPMPA